VIEHRRPRNSDSGSLGAPFTGRFGEPLSFHGYLETCRYLEQEKVSESAGAQAPLPPESDGEDGDMATVFGGAKVGDLVQWEANGALMMERPMRVRLVTEDGQWVAVEGSETGTPMEQVIVQERAATPASPPPTFKIDTPAQSKAPLVAAAADETEWMRNRVGRETSVRLLVSGKMGAKEIGKLITLLEAQRTVLEDDDDEEAPLDKEADNADPAIKGRNIFR